MRSCHGEIAYDDHVSQFAWFAKGCTWVRRDFIGEESEERERESCVYIPITITIRPNTYLLFFAASQSSVEVLSIGLASICVWIF